MNDTTNHWRTDSPDWHDGGRVELKRKDGTTASGRLDWIDNTPGPDEAPVYELTLDDGSKADFWSFAAWRVLP